MTTQHTILLGELLGEPGAAGTIATLNEDGAPHVVPSPFLHLNDDGYLVHLELLETSASHRNLLRSIWFEKPVAVSITTSDGRVATAGGRVYKAHVSGPLFSRYYRDVRSRLGDADLVAVWLIEPLSARDESYELRKAREEEFHPFFRHLDRLATKHNSTIHKENII